MDCNPIIVQVAVVGFTAPTLFLGTSALPVTTVVIGAGDTIASPAAKTVRFTNASGANNAAGTVVIAAAVSTGNATPGSLVLQVGQQVAGSSSTLQTLGNALTLSHTTAGGHLATFPNLVNIGGDVTISQSANAGRGINVLNATNGTNASVQIYAAAALGRGVGLFYFAPNYTSVPQYADTGLIRADGAVTGGLTLATGGATPINFAPNDINAVLISAAGNLSTTGALLVGTATLGTAQLDVQKSSNAALRMHLLNPTNGTLAVSYFTFGESASGGHYGFLGHYSRAFTTQVTTPFDEAGATTLYAGPDGNLNLAADNNKSIVMYTTAASGSGYLPAVTLDASATAGDSRMLLYTVDTGTTQRVKTITNAAILTLLGLGAGRLLYVPA